VLVSSVILVFVFLVLVFVFVVDDEDIELAFRLSRSDVIGGEDKNSSDICSRRNRTSLNVGL